MINDTRESRQSNIFMGLFKIILTDYKKYLKGIGKKDVDTLTKTHEKDIIGELENLLIVEKNKTHRLTYNINLIYSILKSYDVEKRYYKKYGLKKNKAVKNTDFFLDNLQLIDIIRINQSNTIKPVSNCACGHDILVQYIFKNKLTNKNIILGYDCGTYIVKNIKIIKLIRTFYNYLFRKEKETNYKCEGCCKNFHITNYINHVINVYCNAKSIGVLESVISHYKNCIKKNICYDCCYYHQYSN